MRHWFKVCTGAHYLGNFIGDDKSKRDWLKYQTSTWDKKHRNHQNGGEISPGELHSGDWCNSIGMYLIAIGEKRHGICACRSVEDSSRNILPRTFSGKLKVLLTILGKLITSTGKKIRHIPTRPGDISQCKSLIYLRSVSSLETSQEREHFPMPIIFWSSGNKYVMTKKYGMIKTRPKSRA